MCKVRNVRDGKYLKEWKYITNKNTKDVTLEQKKRLNNAIRW